MVRGDPIDAWSVDFFVDDGAGILRWSEGNCSGSFESAQRAIRTSGEDLVVRMKICEA